jgi:hypothetical protein
VGRLQAAAAAYSSCLELEPGHGQAFYAQELCGYYQRRLDVPRTKHPTAPGSIYPLAGDADASADSQVDCYLKDAMCKRADSRQQLAGALKHYRPLGTLPDVPEVAPRRESDSEDARQFAAVVAAADAVGQFVLLNQCKGFLDNARQVSRLLDLIRPQNSLLNSASTNALLQLGKPFERCHPKLCALIFYCEASRSSCAYPPPPLPVL